MNDLNIIRKIEKELKIELIEVDKIWCAEGFTRNKNGFVTGLGFVYCLIKDLKIVVQLRMTYHISK